VLCGRLVVLTVSTIERLGLLMGPLVDWNPQIISDPWMMAWL